MVTRINVYNVSAVLVLFCRIAMGLCVVHWWYESDVLQLSVGIGALTLTLLPGVIIRDSLLQGMTTIVITLLITAHVVLGMSASLYETSYIYDKFMHVLGSSAIAGLLLLALHRYCLRQSIELPVVFVAIIVMGGTLSVGTLWEIFEFTIDRTGLFNAQRGLYDTMLDLIADTTGGFLLVILTLATNFLRIQPEHYELSPGRGNNKTETEVNNE